MHSDHFFSIGTTHRLTGQPCEDYALSGSMPDGRYYGVVTDGCSGAMARTDVGARVLAFAMERAIRSADSVEATFATGFAEQLTEQFRKLMLGDNVMDYLAGVVAFCADARTAKVFMLGDGAFAVTDADGDLTLTEVHWPDNAPYYLGYRLQSEFDRLFRQDVAPHSRVEVRSTNRARRRPQDEIRPTELVPATSFLEGYVRSFDVSGLRTLAVFTDGVSQVRGSSSIRVCEELVDYKDDTGSFVKRRSLRALAAFDRAGSVVEDDLAVAALSVSGWPNTQPGAAAPDTQ